MGTNAQGSTRPPAPPLPDDASEIDARWLDDALKAGGLQTRGSIATATSEPVVGGVGVMGEITRFRLTWGGADPDEALPASVVAKLPSALPENRALGMMMGFYESEHRLYSELSGDLGLRTPRCWFSGGDADTSRYALILEDVGELERVDQLEGADVAHAEQVIDALATMHAKWWHEPKLRTLPWLTLGYGDAIKIYGDIMRAAWPAFAVATESAINEDDRELTQRFIASFDAVVDEVADDPWTLVHRDFRVDNMMFDAEGPVVFDWSSPAIGGGFYDFAYFVGGSLDIDTQQAAWDDLVERYLDGLAARGIEVPSGDQLRRALVYGALYCLIVPVMTVGDTLDMRDERGERLVHTNLERVFTMLHALDAGRVL
jgi:hypothetical protein